MPVKGACAVFGSVVQGSQNVIAFLFDQGRGCAEYRNGGNHAAMLGQDRDGDGVNVAFAFAVIC